MVVTTEGASTPSAGPSSTSPVATLPLPPTLLPASDPGKPPRRTCHDGTCELVMPYRARLPELECARREAHHASLSSRGGCTRERAASHRVTTDHTIIASVDNYPQKYGVAEMCVA